MLNQHIPRFKQKTLNKSMKKLLCLLPLLFLTLAAQAQHNITSDFRLQQDYILRTGMLVLGGWAIINIMLSSFKLTKTTRDRRYFYQMNLYWNIVNLLIASLALHSIISASQETIEIAKIIRQYTWIKKILYLNIGLDVSYIILGAYLRERSKTSLFKTERLTGWGQSIILQGVFLFLLDLVLVVVLESRLSYIFKLIPNI
jgi:hypothetical protein